MDLECLKIVAIKINMPQDMKERIINAVQQSCDQIRIQKATRPIQEKK